MTIGAKDAGGDAGNGGPKPAPLFRAYVDAGSCRTSNARSGLAGR